jgi:hypothetical protein
VGNTLSDERPRGQQQAVVANVETGGFRLGDVKHLTGDGRGREVAQGVQLKGELQT